MKVHFVEKVKGFQVLRCEHISDLLVLHTSLKPETSLISIIFWTARVLFISVVFCLFVLNRFTLCVRIYWYIPVVVIHLPHNLSTNWFLHLSLWHTLKSKDISFRWSLSHQKHFVYFNFRYNHYLKCVVHCPPVLTSPYDGLPLHDFPPLILHEIFQYLDSGSLRCLASTSKIMRMVCFNIASASAMVHIKWARSESGNWSEKCFVSYPQIFIRLLRTYSFRRWVNLFLRSVNSFWQ